MSFYGNVEYGDTRFERFIIDGLIKHSSNCQCELCGKLKELDGPVLKNSNTGSTSN